MEELETALKRVEKKGLKDKMRGNDSYFMSQQFISGGILDDYDAGNRMLVKLRGMERMRHEVMTHYYDVFLNLSIIKIMELKQPTISEIRSYTKACFRIQLFLFAGIKSLTVASLLA